MALSPREQKPITASISKKNKNEDNKGDSLFSYAEVSFYLINTLVWLIASSRGFAFTIKVWDKWTQINELTFTELVTLINALKVNRVPMHPIGFSNVITAYYPMQHESFTYLCVPRPFRLCSMQTMHFERYQVHKATDDKVFYWVW